MAYRRPIEERPQDDEISDELIATIPEVGGAPLPLALVAEEAQAEGAAPPATEFFSPSAFAATLAEVRRHFEETFQAELAMVESSMGAALTGLSEALQQREAEVAAVQQELAALREAHEASERKLQALKAALADG